VTYLQCRNKMNREEVQVLVYNYIYLRNEWCKPDASWGIFNAATKVETRMERLKENPEYAKIIHETLPEDYKIPIGKKVKK